MATTIGLKDLIDLPQWQPVALSPNAQAAGVSICSDMRNSEDRDPSIFQFVSNSILNSYSSKNDGWGLLINPGMAGTFGAGAASVVAPTHGPRGTLAAGGTTTRVILTTALPASVGVNQLANRGDGRGYKIRIIGSSAGGSGKVEERLIVANTGGTTPTIVVDSAFSFTPASGDSYEFLSGRVYLLSASTVASGIWRAYDILTNSMLASLATTNLPTIGTDSSLLALDELYVPSDKNPCDGYFGTLTATGSAGTTLTGHAAGGDAGVAANEYRNFQIRITEDTAIPTAVGQRRKVTSHTAGASPVYTVPTWTVTPSATAKYVIENANEIILWTSTTTNTHTYAPVAIGAASANTWSTSTYAVRSGAMASGSVAVHAFGVSTVTKALDTVGSFRYSFVYVFRGNGTTTCDLFDIAGGATGLWTSTLVYGGLGPLVPTGSSISYDGTSANGTYAYININTQYFFRFDVFRRVLTQWTFMRFVQGASTVGGKMTSVSFIDGATKIGFVYALRATGAELFRILIAK
jgi:hypothetical protein